MDADTLNSRLSEANPPVLIDVLTEASYAAEHIPGAANACVYETAFLTNVKKAVNDPEREVVVYDTGLKNRGASEARRKLLEAGYSRVEIFEGGLEAWKGAGLELEGTGSYADPTPDAYPVALPLDATASTLRWTGRNLANHHWGHLSFKRGELKFEGGRLVGGSMTIDMNSIAVEDIQDPTLAGYLIAHLQDADFFETGTYPEAEVRLEAVERVPGSTPGELNYRVTATLTLKGVTRPLSFEALGGWSPDGKFAAQASLDFDRTEWNVIYGSGKFFQRLGMHMVADQISLQIKLNAG